MSLDENTLPQVVYNTPDPNSEPSELYLIHGTILATATDLVRRWVVKEEHGYWDEQEKEFKVRVPTFMPNEPQDCVSLDDVHDEVKKQVMVRVRQGFRYQMEWYPYEPPRSAKNLKVLAGRQSSSSGHVVDSGPQAQAD